MKKFILLFFSFLCLSVQAQQWLWAYPITFDGSGSGQIFNLMTDSVGHAYVMGDFYNSTHITFQGLNDSFPTNNLKSFVVKYDNSGNIKWVGGGWDSAYANGGSLKRGFSVDKYGNTYITGSCTTSFFGTGTDTLHFTNLQNTYRDFLVKLDSNGKAIFLQVQGDSCSAQGIIVTALPTNELIHIGYKLTSCPYMGGTALQYFKKLDAATGNSIWSLIPNDNILYYSSTQIIPTKDNGFLINGRYRGDSARFDGLTTHQNLSSTSWLNWTFLVKYSSSGEVLWAKKVSDTDNEWNEGATVDGDNNIIFAVETRGTATYESIPLPVKGDRTLHLIKTDALGNYIMHKSFNSGSYSHFRLIDIQSDKDGNIYVSAKLDTTLIFGSDTVFYNSNPLNRINAIIKFDSDFNYLWSQYVSGYNNGGGQFAITDSIIYFGMNHDADVYLHGSSYYFPAPYSPRNASFVAAIKNGNIVSVPTIVHQIENEKQINIFPNPSSGIFTVQISNCLTGAKIIVNDVLGNCLLEKYCRGETSQEINLSCQSRGIYFMEIVSDGERIVKKIVLQ